MLFRSEELLKKKEVKEALGVDTDDDATKHALKEIACETSVRFKEIIERVKLINPPEVGYSKSEDNPDRLYKNAILILKSQEKEIGSIKGDNSEKSEAFEKLGNLLGYLEEDGSCLPINDVELKRQLKLMSQSIISKYLEEKIGRAHV